MEKEVIILIAEDDDGHATLIQRNLKRAGIVNEIIRFKDGQDVLEYLFQKGEGAKRKNGKSLLLLLDIRMPKIDGIEVLKRVKADDELKKMPVMMITTTDDPREVENCHRLGCNNYVTKPIDYEKFVDAIRKLGLFLLVVQVPVLNGKNGKRLAV
jgi:CheY-like chemotaxis protein